MQRTSFLHPMLVLLMVILVISLVDSSTRASQPRPQLSHFGVEINREQVARTGSRVSDANLSWVRYNAILWSEVEAVQGVRDWSVLADIETELQQLNAMGATPVVIVRGTPDWAQQLPGTHCGPIKPEAMDRFASFMHELVAHYSQPPYNIFYWEIWNEPDVDPSLIPSEFPFGCWGDQHDPYYGAGSYAEMLKHAYPAIKRANPQAQVILGGLMMDCDATRQVSTFYLPLISQPLPDNQTANSDTITSQTPQPSPDPPESSLPQPRQHTTLHCPSGRFFEGVLQHGGGDAFDIVAYHSYAFWDEHERDWEMNHAAWRHRGGAMLGRLDLLRSTMVRYGINKPVLLNEGSLLCHNSSSHCFEGDFLDDQANYVVRFYTRSWAHGLLGASWYTLNDPDWQESGLMNASDTSRPAFLALQFLSNLLGDANYMGMRSTETVEGYAFVKGTWRYEVYWTNDTTSVDLPLPEHTVALYNKFGQPLEPISDTIQIGFDPVILAIHP